MTTRRVFDRHLPVARVSFDEGCYDVLDERGYDADDLCVVYLGELVKRHPALEAFADLPEGQTAALPDGPRSPISDGDREQSVLAWKSAAIG